MNYVLKLCGWYPSRVDHLSGDFVQRQAIAISGQCKTVVLFAQKDQGIKSKKIEHVFTQTGNLFEHIYYYPQKKWLDKIWSQWYYLRILKMFLPTLLKEHGKPDLLHINIVWRAAIWGLYLHSKYKWPIVITENSTEYQVNALENIRNKGWWRKRITRKAFKKSLLFLPVSKQLAETVQELYGTAPFEVIPNVVDISKFIYEPKPVKNAKTRILHISTMGYQKNIEGLVRVLQQLALVSQDFEVILAGPENEEIMQTVKADQSLAGVVRFTGSISYTEVAALMKTADLFLLFSRYENLPCVILEALCTGVPVITSGVGGIPEIVNAANGVIVASEDEKALLDALTNFLQENFSFDHKAISEKATALYNYETVGRQFMEAYQKLLSSINTSKSQHP